jgi:hypothetical protein
MAPSRKWIAATIVAAGALGTAFAQAGEWSSTLTVMAIGLVVERATAYLVSNKEDDGDAG